FLSGRLRQGDESVSGGRGRMRPTRGITEERGILMNRLLLFVLGSLLGAALFLAAPPAQAAPPAPPPAPLAGIPGDRPRFADRAEASGKKRRGCDKGEATRTRERICPEGGGQS